MSPTLKSIIQIPRLLSRRFLHTNNKKNSLALFKITLAVHRVYSESVTCAFYLESSILLNVLLRPFYPYLSLFSSFFFVTSF